MESTLRPDDRHECRMCYRRMAPMLRAVRSGLVLVCPHCLTPYRTEQAGLAVKGAGAYSRETGARTAYRT
jgi:hypothetical protein